MPQVTRSAHSTTVSTNLPDNNTGSITPSGHRGVVTDLRDSAVWRNTGGVAPASAPELEGDTYTDTVAGKHYFATGVAAASDYQAVQNELAEGQFADGDKTKLDGIETGATADQTGAEIDALLDAELGHANWARDWTADQGATDISAANIPDLSGTYEPLDVDILRADTADNLTVGFTTNSSNQGTQSTGTFTPDPTVSQMQNYINGGAHTLGVPASNCCINIQVTNNASAGAITTTGFSIVGGDALTTTNGDDFMLDITVNNGFSRLMITALQ